MKRIRIAAAYGDGIGKEIIGSAVRLLRAAYERFSVSAMIFPFEIGLDSYVTEGETVSAKAIALAGGCDAVLTGPVNDEGDELKFATALGAGFCTMPVFYSPQVKAAVKVPEQKLRPSVRLNFVVLKSFNSLYSKVSADNSVIFETVANHKTYFKNALEHCAVLAMEGNRKVTIVKMGVDPYYKTEIKNTFSSCKQRIDFRHITPRELAGELCVDPGSHQVVLAPFIEGSLLHAQAVALISAPQVCYKEYIGSPRLYMPLSPPSYGMQGQGHASPVGALLAASALTGNAIGHEKCAFIIRKSVFTVLERGYKTADMAKGEEKTVSTDEFTDLVIEEVLR